MIKGLDISSVQGRPNFVEIAATGVQFVILKCGNGNDNPDPDYAANLAAAKTAGLQVACYHFVYPLPTTPSELTRSPQIQAQNHFNSSQGVLACMDLEWPDPQAWTKWGCNAAQINQWGLDYLAHYSQLSGQQMIVYTYPNFAATVKLSAEYAQYPLWIASYEPTPAIPAPWSSWVLWQTTGGGGKLPNGAPVDTDVANDLSLWGVGSAIAVNTNDPNPVVVSNDPNPPAAVNDPNPPSPAVSTVVSAPLPTITVNSADFFTDIWAIICKLFHNK